MDRRIRERRREIARGRGRHRLTLAILAVLLLACVGGFLWLRSSDALSVTRIIGPSSDLVGTEEVSDVLGDVLGQNLLQVQGGELEETLCTLPYVREARVVKRFPHTLEVRLVEYVPAVRLKDVAGTVWLVSEDGRVLEMEVPGDGSAVEAQAVDVEQADPSLLPLVIAGEEAVAGPGAWVSRGVGDAVGLALVTMNPSLWPDTLPLEAVHVDGTGSVTMALEGGTRVKVGTCEKLEEKLMVATQVIDQYLRDGKLAEYVDVRVPDRVVAKKRDS